MTGTKHTPGPWHVSRGHQTGKVFGISSAAGNIINFHGLSRPHSDEGQANAHLIVAAPELLAACKAQEEFVTHGEICPLCANDRVLECKEFRALSERKNQMRRDAIAKAEGSESK